MRGYHPLLAIAAGTGDVLIARLRGGNANSGRSAGHLMRETIGRVRAAGATGQLTVYGKAFGVSGRGDELDRRRIERSDPCIRPAMLPFWPTIS